MPALTYNFLRGHPNTKLLPTAEMQQLLLKLAQEQETKNDGDTATEPSFETSLNYLSCDQGDPACLAQLQAFLQRHTKQDEEVNTTSTKEATATSSLSLFLTHGVSHGLDLLCAAQSQPGDVVMLERPTYFLAADIFQSHHLQLQVLPMRKNGGGVDVHALQIGLEQGTIQPPRFIYLVPTHHNPTGRTLSMTDRQCLVQLARQYNFLIIADEVYHLLDWRKSVDNQQQQQQYGRRPSRMAMVGATLPVTNDDNNNVGVPNKNPCISVSSFTKIFCPGIRLGWIEASFDIIESLLNLGYIKSQGGCAPFMGDLMRVALQQGLCDSVLTNLNAAYQERSAMLCRILQTEPRIQIHQIPLGGYFVWISFHGIDDTSTFLSYCHDRGLGFLPGSRCGSFASLHSTNMNKDGMVDDDECKRSARLCFADMDVPAIEQGAKLLVECYRDYMDNGDHGKNLLAKSQAAL